jgi:MOSC domain-containing protein YiiM
MNSRVIEVICDEKSKWKLAGDQLYIDINLEETNLPAGSMLSIGSAVVQITPVPHNGCKKFAERFGVDAVVFVNSATGKKFHLRGVNAKVITPGIIQNGDRVNKI